MKIAAHEPSDVVCVIGVGFVGLTLSISLCDAGFSVLGWEKNPKVHNQLSIGYTDVIEPGIREKLTRYSDSGKFRMIESSKEASEATVFIVTVGTPIKSNELDHTQLEQATHQLIPALKNNDLVIIRSTTAIGTCSNLVFPMLQATGKSVLLAMCPERTVEGRALEEMASLPQIIGSNSEKGFEAAAEFFSSLGPEIVKVESLESAELAKLVNNTYRDLMFAFANEIADISLEYGINPSDVIRAANHNYVRSNIALPGISGGPCLEKDPWILVQSGKKHGLEMQISKSSRIVNEKMINRFLQKTISSLKNVEKIAILGLSFKGQPETLDTRGSAIFPVIRYLRQNFPNANISGFEPAGFVELDTVNFTVCTSIEETLMGAELVILLTNSPNFDKLPELASAISSRSCLFVDFWGRKFQTPFLSDQAYISWAGQ